MSRKKKRKEGTPGAPLWMVTYSDMVTLLLTFFVLLLSMSQLDRIKFNNAAGSLKGAFGVLMSANQNKIDTPKIIEYSPIDDDYVQRVYQKMTVQIQRLRLDEEVELVKDRGAVILRIKDAVLFGPGSHALRPEADPVLRKVAALVRTLPLSMRIEGHADNTVSTSGLSNWDFSALRSLAVLKFFAREGLFPLDRMAAAGYGDQRPIAPNDTPENRALNRRVEFYLENLGDYREELPYLIDSREQSPF